MTFVRRFLFCLFVVLSLGLFSACALRDETRQKFDEATEEMREKALEAKEEFDTAKEKTEQKIEDINAAVKAVNKALGDGEEEEKADSEE